MGFQIYVEVERACLTQMVADRKWKEGKKQEAAQMMLELHVETYSAMEIKEKVRTNIFPLFWKLTTKFLKLIWASFKMSRNIHIKPSQ